MKKLILIAIVACLAPWSNSATAQNLIVKNFGASDSLQKFPPHTAILNVVQGNKPLSATSVHEDEKVNVIIQFSSPPKSSVKGLSSSKSTAASKQQSSFISNISAMHPTTVVSRRFTEVLNAMAITVSKKEIGAIAQEPGVQRVYEDKKVSALAVTTPSAIDSPSSDEDSDSSGGNGIKIGVIDTGIDYLHEAFGGGFGPGFTVAGGYNFVTNNPDPRDDNGHGTHVAGIIAGNAPSFKGVAPHARLYAYKVLDANGNGSMSTVIAAIEQAVKDSVQIINLSLGTSDGDPDDILSQAVDQAVEAGVVVVVAAGNDGDYGTIDSPGAAREALTVGATNAENSVASFSSRGPSNKIYGCKPDIVAPGESILSAKMNGGYIAMTGTSMAAPFVAGAAALLKQRHPEWNAYQIRDALIASTRDLHAPIFSEGRGKLDTARISTVSATVSPSTISFGFDNPSIAKWNRGDTVLISNLSSTPKTYSIKNSSPAPGITVVVSPTTFSIDANGSQNVAVELSADNTVLPDNAVFPLGYGGNLLAISDADTLTIPYVFFKGSVFQISFNETPFQVLIHDGKKNAFYYNPSGTFLSAFVPPGTYDIVTTFTGSAYVVKENINTKDSLDFKVNRSQASHEVVVSPTDENDSAFVTAGSNMTYSYIEALRHTASGISEVTLGGGNVETQSLDQKMFFSDMSPRYSFGYALNIQMGNSRSYTYDVELDTGITSAHTVAFTSSDFKRIDFKYDVDSTTPRIFPVIWSAFAPSSGVVAVTYFDGNSAPLTYPFMQTGYYTRRTSIDFPILHFREAYKY
ncbi:MAG TPA: S8 family serine peptidase [Bacteroidota bacterium]|nr:S8 family serine peptidase [Bacteroidota bacterium]